MSHLYIFSGPQVPAPQLEKHEVDQEGAGGHPPGVREGDQGKGGEDVGWRGPRVHHRLLPAGGT